LSETSFEIFEHFMTNIIGRSSGLISFNVASKVAAEVTGQVMAPIFAQVNPDVVGSDFRDLRVAIEYGTRLIQTSKNAEQTTVHQLVTAYPSHDFIIDDEEAKKLFKNIEKPAESLYRLMGVLAPLCYTQASPAIVKKLETDKKPQATGSTEPPDAKPKRPRRGAKGRAKGSE
jgi:hypothetical protein